MWTVAGDVWMVDPVMTGEQRPVRITQVVFDAYQGAAPGAARPARKAGLTQPGLLTGR